MSIKAKTNISNFEMKLVAVNRTKETVVIRNLEYDL